MDPGRYSAGTCESAEREIIRRDVLGVGDKWAGELLSPCFDGLT